MLNIRGSDVPHCPVAISYALITPDGASLFVDQSKVPPEVKAEMKVEDPFAERLLSIDTIIRSCGSLQRPPVAGAYVWNTVVSKHECIVVVLMLRFMILLWCDLVGLPLTNVVSFTS